MEIDFCPPPFIYFMALLTHIFVSGNVPLHILDTPTAAFYNSHLSIFFPGPTLLIFLGLPPPPPFIPFFIWTGPMFRKPLPPSLQFLSNSAPLWALRISNGIILILLWEFAIFFLSLISLTSFKTIFLYISRCLLSVAFWCLLVSDAVSVT